MLKTEMFPMCMSSNWIRKKLLNLTSESPEFLPALRLIIFRRTPSLQCELNYCKLVMLMGIIYGKKKWILTAIIFNGICVNGII